MTDIPSFQDDNGYLAALDVVAESEVPVGSLYLRRALSERGSGFGSHVRAASTHDGRCRYVESMSRKGRVATARGHRVLQEWRECQSRDRSQLAFIQSLKVHNPDELIDVLVARRAMEGEAAALAAENASPEEIGRLRNIVKAHEKALAAGESAARENTDFHLTLAEASKNKVIVAALDVIYRHPDVMRSLEYIRAREGSKMAEDHNPIIGQ